MAGRTALVVIDVQLGMFETAGVPPVPGGELLLEKIEGLVREAREAAVTVVYVRHCGEVGHPLEEGGEGWEIHPRIAPAGGEPVVEKRTPDSFLGTTLREELESRDVGRLILTGMQTEYCVDTTCRRAFSLGYDVTLIRDAHGTWDGDDLSADQIIAHHNATLGDGFATVVGADEVRLGEPATR